jgi:hypothetical protein
LNPVPAAGTAAVPADLATIESKSKEVFNAAEAKDWHLVFSDVDVVVRNGEEYELRMPVNSP